VAWAMLVAISRVAASVIPLPALRRATRDRDIETVRVFIYASISNGFWPLAG
jgi:hypothetical protein